MKKSLNVKTGSIYMLLFLFLFSFSANAVFAQKTVTGTVTGTDDLGIPGVNIIVKGTTQGTITDIDGNYSIPNVSDGDVLTYSFIGYTAQEITVGNQTVINVVLESDAELLDDVVVVGYGQQKKATVVGAITQAKGEELLQAGSVTTVSEALTGLLPGVTTMQAAGQPGSTAAEILIRGRGSWTSSTPLMLVDGVERDFNDLDPNEIESISVLKDASATAVYGVKGANGVILVTTKSGKTGKAKVSFSANMGMKDPTIDNDYVADYATNLEYLNLAKMNDHNYSFVPQSYIDKFRDPAYADHPFYQYTSFVNDLIGRGYTQQYNLNMSGGNDFVKYFTSIGYHYDGDIFDLEEQPEYDPRTYQHRYNWRSNLDFNFTKTTKFSVKLSGDMTNWNGNFATNESGNGVGNGAAILSRMYSTTMVSAPPVFEDGRLGYDPGNVVNVNYWAKMEREGAYQTRKNRLYSDFILKQNVGKYFSVQGKFSYNYYRRYLTDINKRYNSSPIYYEIRTLNQWTPRTDENGELVIEPIASQTDQWENPATIGNESLNGYSTSLYYEFSGNYNRSFGDHDVSGLALWQRRKFKSGANFPRYEESWVGRVTYAYKDKYLFEANGAYNGNENFAPGKRFGFFPSVSGGWVLSEEDFIKSNLNWIDFLKVRYSYGKAGTDSGLGSGESSRFRYISTYTTTTLPMEYGYKPSITGWGSPRKLPMYVEGQPPVPDVTWETSTKQNLGFELNVLDNRLQSSLDFFDEHTDGILMQRNTVPNWFGNEAPYANMGETKNHGFDLELNWNDKIGNDIRYWVKGNVSISESRIVNRDDPPGRPEYRKDAGMPIGVQKGFTTLGLYQNWDEVYAGTSSPLITGYIPGDLKVNDFNADGVIDDNDYVAIGFPSYASKSFALSFGINYRNFSLTTMFNGMWDISKNLSRSYLFAYEGISAVDFILKNNEQKDAWTPWNTDSEVPVLHATSSSFYSKNSEYTLRDASFLRLRNVELKYSLPKDLLKRTNFFEKVEIYVNGNNLYTWQNLPKAVDPEARKLEVYPITKRYNVGCRLSF